MSTEEHPFAPYVRILGRGKTLSRSFTEEEAEASLAMILNGEALPEQIGAFMMLLRFQEETAEEIAGFVRAVRKTMNRPAQIPETDLDWSSYAGKRRQLPWFILSALLLARNGTRVLMHGTEGHTAGRVYTSDVLASLGVPVAANMDEAASQLSRTSFAYVPLEVMSPRLRELINLRHIFGLRSPVHTFSRMVNPFDAPVMMQGIFHRGFMEVHQGAGALLGQPHLAVFRGEGGEIERRVNKTCEVWTLHDGIKEIERWPRLTEDPRQAADEDMDITRLARLWAGDISDDYAEAAIIGTAAIALKAMGRASSMEAADAQARTLWEHRDRGRLPAVA